MGHAFARRFWALLVRAPRPPASARPGEDLHKRLPFGVDLYYPPYVDTRTVYTDTHRHDTVYCVGCVDITVPNAYR